jgi:N-acetylglucosaminyldiphosphoundecaprenol N-acetyl-beta-D-mannosaminyltransferase
MTLRKQTITVLQAPIDAVTWNEAISRISSWASRNESRYVCICNAHSVVTAGQDAAFGTVVSEADLATPDGAPVAWMMRKLGKSSQERINGPDLMWKYCEQVAQLNESIYLYGSTEDTLGKLQSKLLESFPTLRIAGAYSPPFRALTELEDCVIVDHINASGAGTVWVSLGAQSKSSGWQLIAAELIQSWWVSAPPLITMPELFAARPYGCKMLG